MHRNREPAVGALLTLARDLKRRKARERAAQFVVEGARAVDEVVRSSCTLHGALATRAFLDTPRGVAVAKAIASRGARCHPVSDADFRTAASTEAPQGIVVIADVPAADLRAIPPEAFARVLVLDGVQDPGNTGTLLRTAAAFGAGLVVALPGTADPWNAKVVRSAAGGHFHTTVTTASLSDLLDVLREHDVALWGADASGASVGAVAVPARLALAVGNEGAGLSASVRDAASTLVSLPMARGVESLNVAVAAGVLLFALRA